MCVDGMCKGSRMRSHRRGSVGDRSCGFSAPAGEELRVASSSQVTAPASQKLRAMLLLDVQNATSFGARWCFDVGHCKLACDMHTAHDSWAQREQCNHAGMLAITAMSQVSRDQYMGGRVGCTAQCLPVTHDKALLAPRSRSSSAWGQINGQGFEGSFSS